MQRFDMSDVPAVIDVDDVEIRAVELGEMTITLSRLPSNTNLRSILGGLPCDRCPSPHWGYVISGRLRIHTATGAHDVEQGQAFYVEPGHTKEVLEDAEVFEVSPISAARQLHEHLQRRIELAQGESD